MMKVSLAITLLLITVALGFYWKNHQRLSVLQNENERLSEDARMRGLSIGSEARGSKIVRKSGGEKDQPDPRQIAEGFIAYAKEMGALDRSLDKPDKATRQRMIDQMDLVMRLKGKRLEQVIDIILNSKDESVALRAHLVTFLMKQLAEQNPEQVIKLLNQQPDLVELLSQNRSRAFSEVVSKSLQNWARTNVDTAMEWYRGNHERFTKRENTTFKYALVKGTAKNDVYRALKIAREFEIRPSTSAVLRWVDRNPDTRRAALGAYRTWLTELEKSDGKKRKASSGFMILAMGYRDYQSEKPAFASTTRWISSVNPTMSELELFVRPDLADLSSYIKGDEAGQWVEWLGNTFPEDVARSRIEQFAKNHRTKEAVKKWLSTAPDCPAKRILTSQSQ